VPAGASGPAHDPADEGPRERREPAVLLEMIERTFFAVSIDETRYDTLQVMGQLPVWYPMEWS